MDESGYLGKGGNGEVYEWSLQDLKFASKHVRCLKVTQVLKKVIFYPLTLQTQYRPKELQFWSQMNHDNVMSLLGVVTDYLTYRSVVNVYQLMPRMTGNVHVCVALSLH